MTETARDRRARKRAEAEQRNTATAPERRRSARRPCPTGKHKYATEHEARVELVGMVVARNRGKVQRRERRVYRCPACGGWHATSAEYRRAR